MGELKLQHCRVDNRYDITECLGHGSYAEIYVAHDIAAAPSAPPQVVIKALDLYLQGTPDEELERTLVENFQNEAVALDRVRHPQIISRLGHGTAIDLAGKVFHYLVLEYMPGGDLAALCRQRALPIERAIHYLGQICAGLDHAHSRGVIHRDIKPHNLLLSRDLQIVKIADFGVAKLEASDEVITRVGTDVYAAPEHHPMLHTGPLEMAGPASRKRGLTPAADVYSLAKTTYTMLTGESPRRFAQKPITGLPPASEQHFWSAPVLDVLRRATDPQVEGRFQSAHQFLSEMREAALAPTRLLDETTVAQVSSANARAIPPPAPIFSPSEVANQQVSAEPHPRIVVSLDSSRQEAYESLLLRSSAHQQSPAPAVAAAAPQQKPVRRIVPFGPLLRSVWLPLVLIFCLSGVLLATHSFFGRRTATVRGEADIDSPLAGREAIAKTDINLRPDPSRSNQPVGKVEWRSRVRILKTKGNWAEIQILQRGRESRAPDSSDRGWVDKDFLDLQ